MPYSGASFFGGGGGSRKRPKMPSESPWAAEVEASRSKMMEDMVRWYSVLTCGGGKVGPRCGVVVCLGRRQRWEGAQGLAAARAAAVPQRGARRSSAACNQAIEQSRNHAITQSGKYLREERRGVQLHLFEPFGVERE
eukprot:2619991-Prymnesium_polylepis.1